MKCCKNNGLFERRNSRRLLELLRQASFGSPSLCCDAQWNSTFVGAGEGGHCVSTSSYRVLRKIERFFWESAASDGKPGSGQFRSALAQVNLAKIKLSLISQNHNLDVINGQNQRFQDRLRAVVAAKSNTSSGIFNPANPIFDVSCAIAHKMSCDIVGFE
ncbi:MAG: hypothetical protein GY820_11070 [Gammaproteobacteria bacterium]|nr:hypothetical protein [Gammaproteobacteria bacterium]